MLCCVDTKCVGHDFTVGKILRARHSTRTNEPFSFIEASLVRQQVGFDHNTVGSAYFLAVFWVDRDREHIHASTPHDVDCGQRLSLFESGG